jgi:hypothetical protein
MSLALILLFWPLFSRWRARYRKPAPAAVA